MDQSIQTAVAQTALLNVYLASMCLFYAVFLIKEWRAQFLIASSFFFLAAIFLMPGPRAFIAHDQVSGPSFSTFAFESVLR
jgi:hypothetical protein